jgi:acetoin utilization deacetylase AcuC-like enzyme
MYLHQTSWPAAVLRWVEVPLTAPSAGSCLSLLEAVLEGRVRRGMALVRPPGHHAMKGDSCGYCLVNNVRRYTEGLLDSL